MIDPQIQKAASAYSDCVEQLKVLKEAKNELKEKLVAAMAANKLSEVVINGKKFEIEYKEEHKIKIKKA